MMEYDITIKWLKSGRNGQAELRLNIPAGLTDEEERTLILAEVNKNRRKPVFTSEVWETDLRLA